MKWKQTLAIAAALILILAAGCSSKSSSEENGKLKVVTTYSILYDIVKQVGGITSIYTALYLSEQTHMNTIHFLKTCKKRRTPMSSFTTD